MILVLDNTVMSNFALVGQPVLLSRFWPGSLVTVKEAWHEWQTGIKLRRFPPSDFSWISVLRLTAEERALRDELMPPLDLGEASCLALAHARGHGFLTDDRIARREARRLGVPLSGTIGVLVSLIEDGLLERAAANEILRQMIAAGYHSPVATL